MSIVLPLSVAPATGRASLLAGAALITVFAAIPGLAQSTPAATAAASSVAEAETGTLVVTGSRIARDGFAAPTPVAVIGAAELKAEPQANIGDFINTLPSVRGSQTSSTNSGSLSNGQAGIATVNLRALGAQRTLVLIDGQRSVASTTVGFVDTQTIPQGPIKKRRGRHGRRLVGLWLRCRLWRGQLHSRQGFYRLQGRL